MNHNKKLILFFALVGIICLSHITCLADILPMDKGITFGMDPSTIIAIEEKRGNYAEKLYESDRDFQLYYGSNGIIFDNVNYIRMEYDFTKQDKTLYQYYYCAREEKNYSLLLAKIAKKFKIQGVEGKLKENAPTTPCYKEIGNIGTIKETHWRIPNGNFDLLVDLWYNEYQSVFLVFSYTDHDSSTSRQTSYSSSNEFKTLKKGDKGTQVTELQRLLEYYGYYSGRPTGTFDNNTVKAVKDFQINNDIQETGQCDFETWIVINGSDVVFQSFVYKSRNGNVYHSYDTCSGMKSAQEITLSDALRKNLYPCQHCH